MKVQKKVDEFGRKVKSSELTRNYSVKKKIEKEE